jgi:hypothetical protein
MKFTTRDLLWLTALAAVLLAWWKDRQQLIKFHELDLLVQSVKKEAGDKFVKDAVRQMVDQLKKPNKSQP